MNKAGVLGVALVLAPAVAGAEPWVRLNNAQITTALSDQKLVYEAAWQQFYASGRTLYNAGRDSWGYWEARGDRYCSQWPPADGWACYDVEQSGTGVRFIGDSGDITVGRVE